MWVSKKGGSGMKYQEALDDMKRHIVGIPVLGWYYKKDADLLQKLVDEKFEFESRKDYLVLDSLWECVVECYIRYDDIFVRVDDLFVLVTKGYVCQFICEQGDFVIIWCSEDHYKLPKEQFLLCFKPIKEGE